MEQRSYAAVIFDVDGTLVHSAPGIIRAWVGWAEHYGITQDELRSVVGHSSNAIVSRFLAPERRAEAFADIDAREIAEAHDTVAMPGVVEALATVGDRAAIATSGTRNVATARLRAADIVPPAIVVTADDVAHAKPAPDIFLEAAARLGADPQDCLVIEDAPAGITAAKAAGCDVIAVPTSVDPEHLDCPVAASFADIDFARDGNRILVTVSKTPVGVDAEIR